MNSLILCKPKNRRKIFGLNEKNAENYFTISRWIIKWLTRLTVSWNKHDKYVHLVAEKSSDDVRAFMASRKTPSRDFTASWKTSRKFSQARRKPEKRLRAIRVNISCIWKFVPNIRDVKRFLLVTFLTFLRFEKFWNYFQQIITPHHTHTVYRCSLLLQM